MPDGDDESPEPCETGSGCGDEAPADEPATDGAARCGPALGPSRPPAPRSVAGRGRCPRWLTDTNGSTLAPKTERWTSSGLLLEAREARLGSTALAPEPASPRLQSASQVDAGFLEDLLADLPTPRKPRLLGRSGSFRPLEGVEGVDEVEPRARDVGQPLVGQLIALRLGKRVATGAPPSLGLDVPPRDRPSASRSASRLRAPAASG